MIDPDIRGRLLERFYKLRNSGDGWVPISETILAPEPVELRVIGGVCQQLADVGLIRWKPIRGPYGVEGGVANITGKGVAAVEAGSSSEIDLRFPGMRESSSASAATPPGAIDAGGRQARWEKLGLDRVKADLSIGFHFDPQSASKNDPHVLHQRSALAGPGAGQGCGGPASAGYKGIGCIRLERGS